MAIAASIRRRRRALVVSIATALTVLLAAPERAHANGPFAILQYVPYFLGAIVGEVLTPDLFVEITDPPDDIARHQLVLSWPIVLTLAHGELGANVYGGVQSSNELVYVPATDDLRGIFVGRLYLLPAGDGFGPPGLYGEGGYTVGGVGGDGAVVGGGLVLPIVEEGFGSLLLMYRATLPDDGDTPRHALGLNAQLAIPFHALYQ